MRGRATAVGEPLWDCQLPQFTHAAVTMLRSWRSTRCSHRDRLSAPEPKRRNSLATPVGPGLLWPDVLFVLLPAGFLVSDHLK